jgi:hypothetical protein
MDPRRVIVADFNRDGRPDVFIADQGTDLPDSPGHQNTLILSAAGGKLVDATQNLPQQDDYTHAAAVADVNGDGAPDIFVGQIGGSVPSEIQLNDGWGRFSVEANGIPDDLADPHACHVIHAAAFADVDGNGTQDLVIGSGYNACNPLRTGVLLNDGHGRFPVLTQQFPQPPFGFNQPSEIATGDLNGDGRPDIVIAYTKEAWIGRWLQVLINDGHGHFTDETATRLPVQGNNQLGWVKWVRLVDVNGDGQLDIATSIQPTGPPWTVRSPYFLNDGSGHFISLPDNLGLPPIDTYALLDTGGEPGLDVVYARDPDIWLTRTRPPTGTRLYATIGPNTQPSLQLESGLHAQLVRAGHHEIVVWDRSPTDGLRLHGPGINKSTTKPYTGVTYWNLDLKPHSRFALASVANPSHRNTFRTH